MNLKAPRNGSNNLVSEENPNELVLNGNKYNLIERDSPEDVYDDGTSCGIINSRRKSYFSNTLVQQIDKRKKTFALVVGIVILVIVGVTVGCLHLIPDQRGVFLRNCEYQIPFFEVIYVCTYKYNNILRFYSL